MSGGSTISLLVRHSASPPGVKLRSCIILN